MENTPVRATEPPPPMSADDPSSGAGRQASPRESLATLAVIVGVLVIGIRLQPGIVGIFLPLTLSVAVAVCLGFYLRHPWGTLEGGILAGVGKVTVAAVILLLIGALVGVWIQSGTIPTFVYYGMQLISPRFFLPTAFLVCLVMSMATGTSFATIGTVGVALMGIQTGLGLSAPLTAGAVVSGAYFGDKMSPLSDTTNIAAAVGEADLFRHIRSMTYTTFPAGLVVFALFWVAGERFAALPGDRLAAMLRGLETGWHLHPVHLVPIALMLTMALKRMPTMLILFANVLIGGIWAIGLQGVSLRGIFLAATTGFRAETGVQAVDQVLTRGGMASMQAVIILVLLAGALGGALQATGALGALAESMVRRVKRTGTLIASVLASCYLVNLLTGNQILSLILPGQTFLPVFRKRLIDPTVLTRSLEDAGTLSAPLVPWGIAGGVCSSLLNVPTVDYLPYVWLAFAVPVFSLLLGYTGIAVWPIAATRDEEGSRPRRPRGADS